MKIFLIRHLEAIDYETETVRTDEYRFLTPKGRKIGRTVFKALKDELADLEKIFTSPLIRAVQTAEVLAGTLKYRNDVELVSELSISSGTTKILQLLKRNSSFGSVALVGHEPMMSALVELLSDKNGFYMPFKKSGVCLIDYDVETETGKFQWFFNPTTLEYQR